jgi:hypothetical protein
VKRDLSVASLVWHFTQALSAANVVDAGAAKRKAQGISHKSLRTFTWTPPFLSLR